MTKYTTNHNVKKPIRILFDANPLISTSPTGVSRVTKGLINALSKEFPNDIKLVGHYFNFMGRSQAKDLPKGSNITYRQTTLVHRKVFNMLRRLHLPIPFEFLVKERGDFILFPDFLGWPSLFHTPSAPFIHDITYLDYPKYVSKVNLHDLRALMPKTISRAGFVMTNSNSSKKGIKNAYGVPDKSFLVEHIPPVDVCDITIADSKKRLKRLGVKSKFILFFGTLEPRKNLVNLVRAYSRLPSALQNKYALVVCGGKGWNDDEILKEIDEIKKSGANIIETGYVSNEDRAALFMNSSLYVMPSYYEGFGMQTVEAMYYKAPMLLSNIPVLHEVAGDSAEYCNTDAESIKNSIASLLCNDKRREALVKNGSKRLSDLSWQKVAQDVVSRIRKSI